MKTFVMKVSLARASSILLDNPTKLPRRFWSIGQPVRASLTTPQIDDIDPQKRHPPCIEIMQREKLNSANRVPT